MVQRTGALKYNMPKRYARAPGDEVKMTFDHQAAAKIAGTAMGTMSAFWMILANFLAIFWFIPVKYSINDLLDSARPHLSDIQAASGYFLFVLEMEGQRMRAYEFLRLRGRPGQGQGQEEVKRTNMSTMGGVGVCHFFPPSIRSVFRKPDNKKKKNSGAHSRVATLIQPSFQKKRKPIFE